MHLRQQRQLETIKEDDESSVKERGTLEEQKDEEVKRLDQMNRTVLDCHPGQDKIPA